MISAYILIVVNFLVRTYLYTISVIQNVVRVFTLAFSLYIFSYMCNLLPSYLLILLSPHTFCITHSLNNIIIIFRQVNINIIVTIIRNSILFLINNIMCMEFQEISLNKRKPVKTEYFFWSQWNPF